MINWTRLFAELGWAMAMADPTGYSYYLASRFDSTTRTERVTLPPPMMIFRGLRYENRVRPTVLRNTSKRS